MMRLLQKWSGFFSSSRRQVFSPLHHFLYLSHSKEWHSLEPCLRQGWQDPNGWLTEWVSSVRIRRKTLTAFAVSILAGMCVSRCQSFHFWVLCVHMCDFPCARLCVSRLCLLYVILRACGAQCVPIYFVHVPALTWCIAVYVRIDIDSMM